MAIIFLKLSWFFFCYMNHIFYFLGLKIWHSYCSLLDSLTHFCPPLRFHNQFLPPVPTFAVRETDVFRHNGGTSGAPIKPLRDDSALRALSSQGFKGGTRGAPIMPRDVSLSDSKCWNGGQKWVNKERKLRVNVIVTVIKLLGEVMQRRLLLTLRAFSNFRVASCFTL